MVVQYEKKVHENVGIWIYFLTEVFLKGASLVTHMALLKKSLCKICSFNKTWGDIFRLKKKKK